MFAIGLLRERFEKARTAQIAAVGEAHRWRASFNELAASRPASSEPQPEPPPAIVPADVREIGDHVAEAIFCSIEHDWGKAPLVKARVAEVVSDTLHYRLRLKIERAKRERDVE